MLLFLGNIPRRQQTGGERTGLITRLRNCHHSDPTSVLQLKFGFQFRRRRQTITQCLNIEKSQRLGNTRRSNNRIEMRSKKVRRPNPRTINSSNFRGRFQQLHRIFRNPYEIRRNVDTADTLNRIELRLQFLHIALSGSHSHQSQQSEHQNKAKKNFTELFFSDFEQRGFRNQYKNLMPLHLSEASVPLFP